MNFKPTCDLAMLKKRAQLFSELRAFFLQQSILEVDVPVLGQATVTDPYLEPMTASNGQYLQTSPEFFMKRLLAAGSPSIYYLGKAFRADEAGLRHRPEFTMAEWYCLGMDDVALMNQLTQLLLQLAPSLKVQRTTYGELFKRCLGVCPYAAQEDALVSLAKTRLNFEGALANKSAWLDLLFSHCVEPTLTEGFTLVSHYPVEQSALSRTALNEAGTLVARRFELFGGGVELANGYWELTDASEQGTRFLADQELRRDLNFPVPDLDHNFMAALEHGLPSCAGVALGVDRLLMVLTGQNDIASVLPFAMG